MTSALSNDLSASCRAASLLIAQHTKALTEILANLQVQLAEAQRSAETLDCKDTKDAKDAEEAIRKTTAGAARKAEALDCKDTKDAKDADGAIHEVHEASAALESTVARCQNASPSIPGAGVPAAQLQMPQLQPQVHGGKGHGKGGWSPWPAFKEDEPRFDGWTSSQWAEWVQTPCGNNWCSKKRMEAESIADWMVQSWGIATLREGSGVLDIGGEPGWLAAALLTRGISVTVVDTFWGRSGKKNCHADLEAMEAQGLPHGAHFQSIPAAFDEKFVAENQRLVEKASALVSLYGDEATTPCLQYAASTGVPCLLVPCNECVRFFPPHQRNYEGYAQALLADANSRGGRFHRATLQWSPFSRMLLVQLPDSEQGRQMREQLEIQQQQWQQQQQQWYQQQQLQWQQQQYQQQHQQQQQQQQQWQQHPQQWQWQQQQQWQQQRCQKQLCHNTHHQNVHPANHVLPGQGHSSETQSAEQQQAGVPAPAVGCEGPEAGNVAGS